MSLNKMIIPKTISVGFQNRSDTYTKKLAYVIYTDAKGKLRKETSWNSWRNKDIPVEVYDNEPTSGFVLNKKVGDYKSGWDHRSAAVRIFDPRGFEFEISVENLLFILQECSSVKGKGLDGDFVYSWDGTELVLLPTTSQEYKESSGFTALQTKKITKDDIKEGFIYKNKNNERVIYLGRHDWTEYNSQTEYPKDRWGGRDYSNHETTYKIKTSKKHIFKFLDKEKGYSDYNYWTQDGFTKLATIESTEVSPLYADAYDELKKKCKHIGKEFAVEKLVRACKKSINSTYNNSYFYGFSFRLEDKQYYVSYNYKNGADREYYITESKLDKEYTIDSEAYVCKVSYKRDKYQYDQQKDKKVITWDEIQKLIEDKIIFKNTTNNQILLEI